MEPSLKGLQNSNLTGGVGYDIPLKDGWRGLNRTPREGETTHPIAVVSLTVYSYRPVTARPPK